MKPISALAGGLFSAMWLAVLTWVTPYLAQSLVQMSGDKPAAARLVICTLVAIISSYWLFVGVICTLEDITGKEIEKLKPRWLRR